MNKKICPIIAVLIIICIPNIMPFSEATTNPITNTNLVGIYENSNTEYYRIESNYLFSSVMAASAGGHHVRNPNANGQYEVEYGYYGIGVTEGDNSISKANMDIGKYYYETFPSIDIRNLYSGCTPSTESPLASDKILGALANVAFCLIPPELSIPWTAVNGLLSILKNDNGNTSSSSTHVGRSWSLIPYNNYVSQQIFYFATINSSDAAYFTTDYELYGRDFEYISSGKHLNSIIGPDYYWPDHAPPIRPNGETITLTFSDFSELFARVVPDQLLNDRLMIDKKVSASRDEFGAFYITMDLPTLEEIDSNLSDKADILRSLAEHIEICEKIINHFSTEKAYGEFDGIIEKNATKLHSLKDLRDKIIECPEVLFEEMKQELMDIINR